MGKIRKNEAGFSVVEIVVVLAIVGLIGVVGFMVYKNQHKTKPASVTAATTKPTTTPAKTTTSAPTDVYAGWSTYTSAKEGLSFRYPASWTTQDDPCVNPTTQVAGECIKIFTPKTASSPYFFDITYYWNEADETGNSYVVSLIALNTVGAKSPLYMTAIANSDDTSGLIYALNLTNQKYTTGKVSKVASAIPSQSQSGKLLTLQASMTPVAGTQQAIGYTPAQYQAQPDYGGVVKMFQSIRYN